MFSIILACTFYGGIGYKNVIPWYIKEDLYNFKEITSDTVYSYKKNAVIMGKNTWLSLNERPLKNRLNIVITSDISSKKNDDNVLFMTNLDIALNYCYDDTNLIDKIFVIGGAMLYNTCFKNPKYKSQIDKIYLTLVNKEYGCDTFVDIKHILTNYNINMKDIKFNKDYISITAYNNN